jgi:hypothetical protein
MKMRRTAGVARTINGRTQYFQQSDRGGAWVTDEAEASRFENLREAARAAVRIRGASAFAVPLN